MEKMKEIGSRDHVALAISPRYKFNNDLWSLCRSRAWRCSSSSDGYNGGGKKNVLRGLVLSQLTREHCPRRDRNNM